jgi:hypothetical protein
LFCVELSEDHEGQDLFKEARAFREEALMWHRGGGFWTDSGAQVDGSVRTIEHDSKANWITSGEHSSAGTAAGISTRRS